MRLVFYASLAMLESIGEASLYRGFARNTHSTCGCTKSNTEEMVNCMNEKLDLGECDPKSVLLVDWMRFSESQDTCWEHGSYFLPYQPLRGMGLKQVSFAPDGIQCKISNVAIGESRLSLRNAICPDFNDFGTMTKDDWSYEMTSARDIRISWKRHDHRRETNVTWIKFDIDNCFAPDSTGAEIVSYFTYLA